LNNSKRYQIRKIGAARERAAAIALKRQNGGPRGEVIKMLRSDDLALLLHE
jgi:hypothetical protein